MSRSGGLSHGIQSFTAGSKCKVRDSYTFCSIFLAMLYQGRDFVRTDMFLLQVSTTKKTTPVPHLKFQRVPVYGHLWCKSLNQ